MSQSLTAKRHFFGDIGGSKKEHFEQGNALRLIHGRRTPEENMALVKKGYASRNSKHLKGKAIDFVNRKIGYGNQHNPNRYRAYNSAIKQAANSVGLKWGGDFKSRFDPNHVEVY